MEESSQKDQKARRFSDWIGVHLHLHPRFYILLVIAGATSLVLFTGLFFYSMSPSFCNSCHIMRPYYQAWKTSKHNQVDCVTCHMPPQPRAAMWAKFQSINHVVQLVTRKYSSKPYAQIEDASCLRSGCHSTNILAGKITFKKGILFDHKFHLGDLRRGKQLRCTSCHSQIVVGTHIEVTESTCYLCHFKHSENQVGPLPLGNCTTCHEVPRKDLQFKGFTFNHLDFVGARHVSCEKCHQDVIQGEGEAPKKRCYSCHNQPERLAKYGDVTFMHETHVAKRKVDCTRCHVEIKHGLKAAKARFMEYNCEVCHSAIHSGPKEMFMGEGGRGVPPTPNHMFTARLDCLACHVQPQGADLGTGKDGLTLIASEKSCVGCHGNQYQGMLKDWQDTFEVMARDIEPKLKAAQQIFEKSRTAGDKGREVAKLFEEAKYNIDFVKIGKGVHNPFYAAELIQVADRNLDRLFRLIGQSPPVLPAQSPINGGYCAKLCHTKAGVKLPEEISWEKAKLPHTRHAFDFGLGCTTFHSAEKHKAIKISKKDCLACHHSPENTQCSRCHQKQAALYTAQRLPINVPEAAASVKAGKVECVNCHDLSQKQTLKNLSAACARCHDPAYADLLNGLREELGEAQKKTKALLDQTRRKLNVAPPMKTESGQAAALLERGRRAYDFVAQAKGVHNVDLAGRILEQAQQDARKAEELLLSPKLR